MVIINLQLLALKIIETFRQDGLRTTFRKCLYNLIHRHLPDDFDLKYGTNTGGIEPLWKFKLSSPNARFGARYQATPEQELSEAVHFLHENLQTFAFIDLGCGKGRTLLVASNLGFKQVIGVEFVRELVEIARSNLVKRQIVNAIVEHGDAADFHFPNDNAILYLYNPFSQEVLRKVAANLRECHSKKLYVIYKAPKCAGVFDSADFLIPLGCPPAAPDIRIWSMEGLKGAGEVEE